ncbi:putative large secreted protein [Geofilum rubicundum JCM 15548]|uniref:Putative large secreted protein n=1 Tax=Geofilum rubicundum JCM 15548 TaxID=1236989 RepID=A0A0E9LTH2_9BACT|nr:putative large secreted protein [Geofilum rubicundum JCM 15548]
MMVGSCNREPNRSDLKLWYAEPAAQWEEALPLGNGRLGAMVFGNPAIELIQLNENTIWAGSPNRNDNPDALEALPLIRQLIFEGKYIEAQDLTNEKVISKKSHGMPYQTAGNLRLSFEGHADYVDFYRDLDIERAVATTRYMVDEVTFTREVFSSFSDDVIVVRLTADESNAISFTATLDRSESGDVSVVGHDLLQMKGVTSNFEGVEGQVEFTVLGKILNDGGELSATNHEISVEGAHRVTIFVSIGTNFVNYKDLSANADERAENYLAKALGSDYNDRQEAHTAFYQNYFNRVSLDLGQTDSIHHPTDVRIAQFSQGNDPSLAALYFQFGRYLLISSSQPAPRQLICREYGPISFIRPGTVNIP